jgi:hypothetical protein
MTEFSIVHEFDSSALRFWQVWCDGEYHDEFYRSVGITREELSRSDDADRLVVVARYASERQLPSFIRSILGDRPLGYVETTTFHKNRGHAEQRVEPTIMGERTRFVGAIAVEPLGNDRIRRTYSGSIAIDIPLIGKRAEKGTVSELQRTQEQAARVTRDWLTRTAR